MTARIDSRSVWAHYEGEAVVATTILANALFDDVRRPDAELVVAQVRRGLRLAAFRHAFVSIRHAQRQV